MAGWSCSGFFFAVRLLVLRHADADTSAESDELRPLSEKGATQALRVAGMCKTCGQLPDVILHSPPQRARETAEIFEKEAGLPRLIEVGWLACGMSPATALRELAAYAEFPSIMLVGHEPDLSRLVAFLLGLGNPEALHLRKASLTCLTVSDLWEGGGRLEYLLPAKLLKK